MIRMRAPIAALVFLVTLTASLITGCDAEGDDTRQPVQPWRFESKSAPYSVEVPGEWQKASPGKLNQFADLALTVDEQFYLIVIPQELPQYDDVPSPDAKALKQASLGLLKKRVDQFRTEREGPVEIDGEPALSVFAEGMDGDDPVQYITTYVTRGDWGYQVVAWGPQKQQEGLAQATDAFIEGWQFQGATTQDRSSSAGADAGSAGAKPAPQ